MRKCGPLSEGFSTRTSLALALRARVRTVPVKPLPFEVKVPMVAIVVSFQFSGPRPSRPRWLATDRRRSTRTPQGPARSRGQPGRDFLDFREEWTRSGQGKKVATAVAGIRARRSNATTAFGQTCQIEDVVGEPNENGYGTRWRTAPAHVEVTLRSGYPPGPGAPSPGTSCRKPGCCSRAQAEAFLRWLCASAGSARRRTP